MASDVVSIHYPKGCSRSSGCRFYLFIRLPYLIRIMMNPNLGLFSSPCRIHGNISSASAHNPTAEGEPNEPFRFLNVVFINCMLVVVVDRPECCEGVISGSCWFVRFSFWFTYNLIKYQVLKRSLRTLGKPLKYWIYTHCTPPQTSHNIDHNKQRVGWTIKRGQLIKLLTRSNRSPKKRSTHVLYER